MPTYTPRDGPKITRTGSGLPSRIIIHGTEGIGKTSMGALAPKPIFLMTRGETGLLTLIDNGLVPETDHFEEIGSWNEFKNALHWLLVDERPNRTLVIDTLNGAERLCFEHVAEQKYGGKWEYFINYGRGPDVATNDWNEFLGLLDEIRARRKMMVIALCHTRIKTWKNPEGPDFDRYTPDMHDKTWGLACKWADVVLFGNYEIHAKQDKGELRAKGISDGTRVLYTTRTAAWDAKNRCGLPAEIPMGDSADEGWQKFAGAMCAAKRPVTVTNSQTNGAPAGHEPEKGA